MDEPKRFGKILTLLGLIIPASAVALVFVIISFVNNPIFTEPRDILENGSIVHIEESRTHQIFLEDRITPVLLSHDFAFVNTQTGERITSRPPMSSTTYTFGGVSGRLVALVDLDTGSYVIEFAPWGGSGDFVWGFGIGGAITAFVLQVVGLSLALMFSLTGFVILLVLRKSNKIYN